MTLIVGVMTGSQVQLLSDTRITHPDVTQIEETPGRLKLITLSPLICVGYAGQANLAIDHLKNTPIDARSSELRHRSIATRQPELTRIPC